MSRKIPDFSAEKDKVEHLLEEKRKGRIRSEDYELEVVTPYFGGGVDAGENDADMPIRATAIRGQLRYWWRFLFGPTCADTKAMFDAESKIFGNAIDSGSAKTIPCPLTVRVSKPNITSSRPNWRPQDIEQYALFPAATKGEEKDVTMKSFKFHVTLRFTPPRSSKSGASACDALWKQIQEAFRYWCRYGGIGARTRRGCGAIFCREVSEAQEADFERFYKVLLKEVPDANQAWKNALSTYRGFRQQRNPGQDRRPGRSHWKEPDTLRKLANGRDVDPKHKTPIPGNEKVTDDAFPRLLLGGPIVFHSFNERAINAEVYPTRRNDDGKTDRMASPVITRPIYRNGRWYAGILILESPDAILKRLAGARVKNKSQIFGKSALKNEQFKTMKAFQDSRADNAIDALIQYAVKKSGYREYNGGRS